MVKGGWGPCDPPPRYVSILYEAQRYRHLQPLAGIARQPYFRQSDGVLVLEPGYDPASRTFGVFDPSEFDAPGAQQRWQPRGRRWPSCKAF